MVRGNLFPRPSFLGIPFQGLECHICIHSSLRPGESGKDLQFLAYR